ncbi:MAG: ELWxxDGT repeat protein [Bacteroidota bacterium]
MNKKTLHWSSCYLAKYMFMLLILPLCGSPVGAQKQLVKDINHVHNPLLNEYRNLLDVNGILFYVVRDRELWKSDGTESGTVKIKDFQAIGKPINASGTLYFSANDGTTGAELWKSDGSEAGTVKIKDIRPGSSGSYPQLLTPVGDAVYFTANDGATGKELWKTDGTAAGTYLVRDIMRVVGSSNPSNLVALNGQLLFSANNGQAGYELWKSDGTVAGTVMVKDIRAGAKQSSSPGLLVTINDRVYFSANDGISGRELWKTDGTADETVKIKDIRAGGSGSDIDNLVDVNGTLFFSADDGIHGDELWKSDGTSDGTVLVKDMTPGAEGSHGEQVFQYRISNFTNIGGTLYYTAYRDANYFFWKSDGTEAGTIAYMPCEAVGLYSLIPRFVTLNNAVYFFDGDYDQQYSNIRLQLWKESAGSLELVKTFFLNDYYDEYRAEMVTAGGTIYLTVRDEQTEGHKLLKSDGTPAGTTPLIDNFVPTESSYPQNFLTIGDIMYFQATVNDSTSIYRTNGSADGTLLLKKAKLVFELENVEGQLYFAASEDYSGHAKLFKSDGTPSNTTEVPITGGYQLPLPRSLTNVNGILFFENDSEDLWKSDGTSTSRVREFSLITNLQSVNNSLYFFGNDGVSGAELWKSDGTFAGTQLVKDINPGLASGVLSFPNPVVLDGVYYFMANNLTHGFEPWRSDGTEAGTYMLKDIRTGDTVPGPLYDFGPMAVVDSILFFSALDTASSWGLWKSDGTESGTIKIINLNSSATLFSSDRLLFFTVYNSFQVQELWRSDGTTSGTFKLADIGVFDGSSFVADAVTISDVFYLGIGSYSYLSSKLWRSDGTVYGTFQVDIDQGGAYPLAALENSLLFQSFREEVGHELFKLEAGDAPTSPCARSKTDDIVARSDRNTGVKEENLNALRVDDVSCYPNPFSNNIALRVNDELSSQYRLDVLTLNGLAVNRYDALQCNEVYEFGKEWITGIYVLKISVGKKVLTKKVVKIN